MALAAAVATILLALSGQGAWATSRHVTPTAAATLDAVGSDTWHDFDNDGYEDLVIGLPREDVGSVRDAGAVQVLYGSENGLTGRDQLWTQDSAPNGQPPVPDRAETGDHFGAAFAVGDFNNDTYGDLAIGVPGENDEAQLSGGTDSGGVQLLWGSASGLRTNLAPAASQFLTVGGNPDAGYGPHLGAALAALDAWTGDAGGPYADLAIAGPGLDVPEMSGLRVDAGGVVVLAGTADGFPDGFGFNAKRANVFCGEPTGGDRCGSTLAAGDFDDGAVDDLAIGAPLHDFPGAKDAGAVWVKQQPFEPTIATVMYAQGGGARGDQRETGDHFGAVLAAGNLMGTPQHDELVVGTPLEDVAGGASTRADAGIVQVWSGSPTGLAPSPLQLISQDSTDGPLALADRVEAGDRFGAALAVADFGRSNERDLAIGVPGEDLGGRIDVGAVSVLYGSPGGLTIDGSQFLRQGLGGVAGTRSAGDRFGSALAGLEIGHNTWDDLVIGVPSEDIIRSGTVFPDAGAIQALFGTLDGLTTLDQQTITQDSPGIDDRAETGDRFGGVLR